MSTDRRPKRRGVDTAPTTAAVWATVSGIVAQRTAELARPLRVLDLGGGTGGLAVPLAEAGHQVIVVDPNLDALASLRRRAAEAGLSDTLVSTQGDAEDLRAILKARVDLACLHGTLEIVDDPAHTVGRIAEVVTPGGHLSVVTAQRFGAVIARALSGQFQSAQTILNHPDGRWGAGDPVRRRFDQSSLEAMLFSAGFNVVLSHGVRLFSDLVPSAAIGSEPDRAALIALEQAIAAHPEFAALGQIGASLHVVARRH